VNVCAVNGEAISEEEAFCSDSGVAEVAPAKQPDNSLQPVSPAWPTR